MRTRGDDRLVATRAKTRKKPTEPTEPAAAPAAAPAPATPAPAHSADLPDSFRELPSAPLVTFELDDPRLPLVADYDAWVSQRSVTGSIVRVVVRLQETSIFDPGEMEAALLRAGAQHVRPIVPTRPDRPRVQVEGLTGEERLPIPQAFERWLSARKLPKDLPAELVLAEFRGVLEDPSAR